MQPLYQKISALFNKKNKSRTNSETQNKSHKQLMPSNSSLIKFNNQSSLSSEEQLDRGDLHLKSNRNIKIRQDSVMNLIAKDMGHSASGNKLALNLMQPIIQPPQNSKHQLAFSKALINGQTAGNNHSASKKRIQKSSAITAKRKHHQNQHAILKFSGDLGSITQITSKANPPTCKMILGQ